MDNDYAKRKISALRISLLADRIFDRRCLALSVPSTDVARAMGAIFEADAISAPSTNETAHQ